MVCIQYIGIQYRLLAPLVFVQGERDPEGTVDREKAKTDAKVPALM